MRKGYRFLSIIGIALMIGAVVLVLSSSYMEKRALTTAQSIATSIEELIPDIREGVLDDRIDVAMPMLELDGRNFIGLIEIPAHQVKLPIYCEWAPAMITSYPCQYMGSMYDGSLIIGGSDNQGQLAALNVISNDEFIYVTDATGLRYSYFVKDVKRINDVSTEALAGQEADLLLFVKNTYSFDYTIVLCDHK